MRLGNNGGSRLASLVYLLIAASIIYFFYKMVPPYMDFFALEDEANQQLRMAKINSRDVILEDLYSKVKERGLDIKKEDIRLSLTEEGKMDIYIAWQTEVDFGYNIKKVLEFEVDTANYKRNKGDSSDQM